MCTVVSLCPLMSSRCIPLLAMNLLKHRLNVSTDNARHFSNLKVEIETQHNVVESPKLVECGTSEDESRQWSEGDWNPVQPHANPTP